MIPGEDVKIAGVKVGKVESLDVTPDNKAAVVLRHRRARLPGLPRRRHAADPPAVADRREVRRVRADAAARRGHAAAAAAAQDRATARARASTCCRSTNDQQPVDLDLDQQHHCACPTASASAIILNELGTGLAGRGDGRCSLVIRDADPALKETDQVLAILAGAEPDARRPRARLATRCWRRWPASAAHVGRLHQCRPATRRRPTAERAERPRAGHREAARASCASSRPTMRRLGGLADQATPGARRPRRRGARRQPRDQRSSARSRRRRSPR